MFKPIWNLYNNQFWNILSYASKSHRFFQFQTKLAKIWKINLSTIGIFSLNFNAQSKKFWLLLAFSVILTGRRDGYLVFKMLNMGTSGKLTLEEFHKIYEAIDLQWMVGLIDYILCWYYMNDMPLIFILHKAWQYVFKVYVYYVGWKPTIQQPKKQINDIYSGPTSSRKWFFYYQKMYS